MYTNKKVLVLGMGVSGTAAAQFLLKRGATVHGLDRQEKESFIPIFTEQDPENYDLLVVSPGVPPTHPVYASAVENGIEVIGEAELACREFNGIFYGITGTNGKTTVTLLITHVLNACGIPAKAVGNIGAPLTEELENHHGEVIVAELSSYQLETLNTQVIDAGAILNITPDHLDRYPNFEAYAKAKIHMKDCLKPGGKLYVYNKVYDEFRTFFENFVPQTYGLTEKNGVNNKKKIDFLLPVCYRKGFKHDVENLTAAYAICQEAGIGPEPFLQAIETFEKPPHRIEFVRNLHGVNYFNDSKGTNIDAVMRAVEAMEGKVILIAGGLDKGSSYLPWLKAFGEKVSEICAIGEAAPKLHRELAKRFKVATFDSMESAVKHAHQLAETGDNVLLSPGCASFDMFESYTHRGEEFKRLINNL